MYPCPPRTPTPAWIRRSPSAPHPRALLHAFDTRAQDLLLLKRLPADLFVVTPEGDMRLYKLDLYATVEDILTELCADLDLKRPEDYSLEASDGAVQTHRFERAPDPAHRVGLVRSYLHTVLSRELSAYAQNVRPGSKCTLRPRRTALTLARSVSSRLMLGADKLRTKLDVLSIGACTLAPPPTAAEQTWLTTANPSSISFVFVSPTDTTGRCAAHPIGAQQPGHVWGPPGRRDRPAVVPVQHPQHCGARDPVPRGQRQYVL